MKRISLFRDKEDYVKILTNDVYIKFVITEKGLRLPQGVIATVEFSGLGGSKSLEIYPPSEKYPTDRIIAVKEPTRLNKVMGLFNEIFGAEACHAQ